jgi:osmoprotectant transport system permease protein
MDQGFSFGAWAEFLSERWQEVLDLTVQHIEVVAISVAIATVIGVLLGMAVWRRPISRATVLALAGIAITIPSLALLALLTPVLGLGWGPAIAALAFYALLPIIRNTVVGLREVSSDVLESAKGMGLGRGRTMISTQLPIAWPVIITGVRVATQLTIGIAAIAAYVAGPGLGQYIFTGLSSIGSRNAIYYALTGTVMVAILALIVDAVFILIARYTTSRGLRA